MKTINSILLRRKNRIIVPEGYLLDVPSSNKALQYMLTIADEMKQIGYVLSPNLAATLLRLDTSCVKSFYDEMMDALKEKVGTDVEYKPMYKGFPETVIAKSDEELLLDQLFGYSLDFHNYLYDFYYGNGVVPSFRDRFAFDEEKTDKIPLDDSNIEYTVVRMMSVEEAEKMFEDLMAQPEAFSRQDEADLQWYFENSKESVGKSIPLEVPNKENLTHILVLAFNNGIKTGLRFKTATDVLRYAVKLSGGDVSLASVTRFKHFTRSEARLILESLDKLHPVRLEEDIMRRPEQFKRLLEGIHINSERYAKRYPNIHKVMERVYERDTHESYKGKLERLLKEGEITLAAKHLTYRPGEFARSLDRMLRLAKDDAQRFEIIELFEGKVSEIPTKLLWDMSKHFKNRQDGAPRIAMIKDKNAFVPKHLPEMGEEGQFSAEVYDKLQNVLKKGILGQYAKRGAMKYVFIDKELDSYLMPTANRSTEAASKPLTRGTRMKVKDGANILRLFLYWQGNDMDLSVMLADKNFEKCSMISWQNSFRSPYFEPKDIVHSGDITYAKQGAAEFIDLNIDAMKQSMPDIKYAIMFVYSFSKITFNKISKCHAGVMERESMGKRLYGRSSVDECQGDIYEAKTVKLKANLTSNSIAVMPLVYDFETNEVIWVDAACNKYINRIDPESLEHAKTTLDYFSVPRKPSIYEVAMANVEARGGVLVEKEIIMDVDGNEYTCWKKAGTDDYLDISEDKLTVFSLEEGITPYDMEVLLTNYL